MKKLISLFVAVVLVLCAVCACAEPAEGIDTLVYISAGLIDDEGNLVEIPGESLIVLTLNADYTFTMTSSQINGTGTWTEGDEEGTFALIDDENNVAEAELLDEDGTVVISLGDEAVAFVLAPEDYFID